MKPAIEPKALPRRQFASDNYAGICPEAWAAMEQANAGHARAYGDDPWTQRATDLLRELFEINCEVFFTFNGTAANSLALASMCQSYHSIICHPLAHIETDECGGPEFFSNGTKVLLAAGDQGKIDPQSVEHMVRRRDDVHYPKPRVVSVTQATELGTVYSVKELDRLGETARRLNLRIHMDGARFANAVAALNVSPKEITWKVGVDVLCFGGTKNGLAVGEAVVFFKKELAEEFDYRCKQAGQLCSKMRYMAAPWVGMLRDGAWLERAGSANQCAKLLAAEIEKIPAIKLITQPQANAVFVELPKAMDEALKQRGWYYYDFIGAGSRFMCAWDTTEADVMALVEEMRSLA